MHSLFWPVSDILCGGQMLFGYAIARLWRSTARSRSAPTSPTSGCSSGSSGPMRNLGRLIVQTSTGLVSYAA
jgi:ATP-binding cassette, subfamily B, bacterial